MYGYSTSIAEEVLKRLKNRIALLCEMERSRDLPGGRSGRGESEPRCLLCVIYRATERLSLAPVAARPDLTLPSTAVGPGN